MSRKKLGKLWGARSKGVEKLRGREVERSRSREGKRSRSREVEKSRGQEVSDTDKTLPIIKNQDS